MSTTDQKTTDYTMAEQESDEKPFRFLDLPPEIRNMVYSSALVKDYDIEAYGSLSPAEHTTTRSDPKLALLRINRLVYKEALPILYEENYWSFPDLDFMIGFFQPIGPVRRRIRHVVLQNWNGRSRVTRAFHLLKEATGIQSLRLPEDSSKHSRIARDLKPWMAAIIKSSKGRRSRDEILQVVKVVSANCAMHASNLECTDCKTAERSQKFRMQMAKLLEAPKARKSRSKQVKVGSV